MPADQFNVRLRGALGPAVRVRAAQLGIKPRDVIERLVEEALPSWQGRPDQIDGADTGQGRGCPECGGNLQPHPDDGVLVCADCKLTVQS